MTVETADISSSNLSSASYDSETAELTIEFNNGSTYLYSNVPPGIWTGLQASGSQGSYFHNSIKPRFRFEQQ